MKKISYKAFAFETTFITKLNQQETENYKQFFADRGIPNDSKMGVVLDLVHGFPFINDNFMGFLPETLDNSYLTILDSPVNINHNRDSIIGNIIKAELIKNEGKPVILRVCAVLYKDVLESWWIKDIADKGWSMECLYNDYAFAINGKVYKKEKYPEFMERLNDWKEGVPVYDSAGNRVSLILGGIDGTIEFNGCGFIDWGEPADKFANTLLQVANKNKGDENMPKTYTQEELNNEINSAIASAKEEVSKDLNSKLEKAQADLQKKDTEINEMKTKYESVASENEALKNQLATANEKIAEYVLKDRKSALASKGYPEDLLTKKEDFLKSATNDDFNNFVEEFEALAKILKPKQEVKASSINASGIFNLTGNFSDETDGDLSLV